MSRFSTFITVLLTSAITIALTVTVSRWWLVAAVPLTALCAVGIVDVTQRHNNILRNYPILGHARFALLAIRPEIQQYFIERDHDGRPFDRDTRALIYARAGEHMRNSPSAPNSTSPKTSSSSSSTPSPPPTCQRSHIASESVAHNAHTPMTWHFSTSRR
ncbi:MAG: hypothetical protein H6512_05750 [Acidimicrobiia bacterium]|nr:hypothetical protein [Acidimicrobiia bacterium]